VHAAPGGRAKIPEGYASPVTIAAALDGPPLPCPERRRVVPALKRAAAQRQTRARRRTQAVTGIAPLNAPKKGNPRPKNQAAVGAAVAAIRKTPRVAALRHLPYPVPRQAQPGRADGTRPARGRVTAEPTGRVPLNQPAVAAAPYALGWRVDAPTAPRAQLRLTKALWA